MESSSSGESSFEHVDPRRDILTFGIRKPTFADDNSWNFAENVTYDYPAIGHL